MTMNDRFEATIAQLWVYPIKSCAGVSLTQSELTIDGLLFDRAWMVVDEHGDFVSQRECPRMALIQPTVTPMRQLVVRAPGMPDLSVEGASAAQLLRVRVDPALGLVPEISGHRLLVSVRFMKPDAEGRLRPAQADATFELSLCA